MAETKKENVRNIQFLASSIHTGRTVREITLKRVEELMEPTVIASVNALEARAHNDNKETVFVILKNHVGWTKGMIRLHRITFVDEREANFFLSTHNLLAATIGWNEVADEVAIIG
eukprot:scaffold89_cov177-Chaetoceros_neogracile.AAC.2